MLTGELRTNIDKVWNAFWTGGLSNPLTVIEQITYLLFIRRLDELQIAKEQQANDLQEPIEEPIYQAVNIRYGGATSKTLIQKPAFGSLRCPMACSILFATWASIAPEIVQRLGAT